MEGLCAINVSIFLCVFSISGLSLVTLAHCGRIVPPHSHTIGVKENITSTRVGPSMTSSTPVRHGEVAVEASIKLVGKDLHLKGQNVKEPKTNDDRSDITIHPYSTDNSKSTPRQKILRIKDSQGKRRRVRHTKHRFNTYPQKSCRTNSSFVYLKVASDMFGDTVVIYPFIEIGKVTIEQYFFETFCAKEACKCTGVDNTKYRSSCETNFSYTYARVIKNGEIGWTKIMIRSGCSCVIHERKHKRWTGNIIDSL